MDAPSFFTHLWDDYVAIAPRAAALKKAFEDRGEVVRNDHVAFRTYGRSPMDVDAFEPLLLGLGYRRHEPYHFVAKKLDAWSYLPPSPALPRIFFSQLRVDELSEAAQTIIERLVAQVPEALAGEPSALWSGRPWAAPSHADYLRLLDESEYAAWVAAIGLRANHFTIAVHELATHTTLESVLDVVESEGFDVNASGGRIKGSAEVFLEQASTMADEMPVTFAGGETHVVPTCYYEFALRHPTPSGALYEGFVPTSADRIFESTDARR